jgi:hypothetical protein
MHVHIQLGNGKPPLIDMINVQVLIFGNLNTFEKQI